MRPPPSVKKSMVAPETGDPLSLSNVAVTRLGVWSSAGSFVGNALSVNCGPFIATDVEADPLPVVEAVTLATPLVVAAVKVADAPPEALVFTTTDVPSWAPAFNRPSDVLKVTGTPAIPLQLGSTSRAVSVAVDVPLAGNSLGDAVRDAVVPAEPGVISMACFTQNSRFRVVPFQP